MCGLMAASLTEERAIHDRRGVGTGSTTIYTRGHPGSGLHDCANLSTNSFWVGHKISEFFSITSLVTRMAVSSQSWADVSFGALQNRFAVLFCPESLGMYSDVLRFFPACLRH